MDVSPLDASRSTESKCTPTKSEEKIVPMALILLLQNHHGPVAGGRATSPGQRSCDHKHRPTAGFVIIDCNIDDVAVATTTTCNMDDVVVRTPVMVMEQ